MIKTRIIYSLALVISIFYYIFHSGYFSWFLLLTVVSLTPLQLLLSLYIWRTTRVQLHCPAPQVAAGKSLLLQLHTAARLPVCKVRGVLVCQNIFSGYTTKQKVAWLPQENEAHTVEFATDVCGATTCSVQKLKILDLMGLFALPLPACQPIQALVLPAPVLPPARLPVTPAWHGTPTGHAGVQTAPGALREYLDIREYREGDLLQDIHWKLSAKQDKLIVRESAAPAGNTLPVCFAYGGSPQAMCRVLCRLQGLSSTLLQADMPHTIVWQPPGQGPRQYFIAYPNDYTLFLHTLLNQPLPTSATNAQQLLAGAGPVFWVGQNNIRLYQTGILQEVLP